MFFFDLSLNAQFATEKGNKSSSQPVPIVRFPSWFWMVVWAKQRCGSCFSCRRGRGAANPEPVGVRARTQPRGARGFQRMGTASKLSCVQGEPRRRETRTRKNPHVSFWDPASQLPRPSGGVHSKSVTSGRAAPSPDPIPERRGSEEPRSSAFLWRELLAHWERVSL